MAETAWLGPTPQRYRLWTLRNQVLSNTETDFRASRLKAEGKVSLPNHARISSAKCIRCGTASLTASSRMSSSRPDRSFFGQLHLS